MGKETYDPFSGTHQTGSVQKHTGNMRNLQKHVSHKGSHRSKACGFPGFWFQRFRIVKILTLPHSLTYFHHTTPPARMLLYPLKMLPFPQSDLTSCLYCLKQPFLSSLYHRSDTFAKLVSNNAQSD